MLRASQLLVPVLVLLLGNLDIFSCLSSCGTGRLLCPNSRKCVKLSYICDGDNDCGDGSDEDNCAEWKKTDCASSNVGQALCNHHTCVSLQYYCITSDPPCEGPVDRRICQVVRNGVLQKLSEVILEPELLITAHTEPSTMVPFMEDMTNLIESEKQGEMFVKTFNETMKHTDCPNLYTRVGDLCVAFFYPLKIGWGEAKAFCELIGGQLASFGDKENQFISIMRHMREFGFTSDFWIGGSYAKKIEGWTWLTGNVMELGSPFWAVRYHDECVQREEEGGEYLYWTNKTACYNYLQAPMSNTTNMCASLTFKHYHSITDEDCMQKMSPLCLVNEEAAEIQGNQTDLDLGFQKLFNGTN